MDTVEREARYGSRPTPAQQRRLKRKEKSRKAHSHQPEYLHDDGSGYRGVPCSRCRTPKKGTRIGGGSGRG